MKYCKHCGKEVNDGAAVCLNCGCKIDDTQNSPGPARQLKTNRSLLKYILLSIITLGIYGIVVMSNISSDINTIASRYDGKKTMHYCLVFFIFSWLTLGIVPLVWSHRISKRIGAELARRGINYKFGAGTFCINGTLLWVALICVSTSSKWMTSGMALSLGVVFRSYPYSPQFPAREVSPITKI